MNRVMPLGHCVWHDVVVATRWSDEQRADALEQYKRVGAADASRATGIPASTIASWAHRAGISNGEAAPVAAIKSRMASVAARKAQLASDLLDDIQAIRAQLHAPAVERKVVVVSDGKDLGSHAEVVDVERDVPTFADQQRIMTTCAIAIDKVQILTGEATERIEHRTLDSIDAEVARLAQVVNLQAAAEVPA